MDEATLRISSWTYNSERYFSVDEADELPEMLKAGGGSIVNMSSTYGLVASSFGRVWLPTASKAGIIGLTKAAALEYAKPRHPGQLRLLPARLSRLPWSKSFCRKPT